jgi:hypothetical protein
MSDDKSEVLLDRHSSLERRHKDLIETRKYFLDLASPDSSQARVQQNDLSFWVMLGVVRKM